MLDLTRLRFQRDRLITVDMEMDITGDTDPVVIIIDIVTIVIGHLHVVVSMWRCHVLDHFHGVILILDELDWRRCMEVAMVG